MSSLDWNREPYAHGSLDWKTHITHRHLHPPCTPILVQDDAVHGIPSN